MGSRGARVRAAVGRRLVAVMALAAVAAWAVGRLVAPWSGGASRGLGEAALGVGLVVVLGLLGVPATLRHERLRRAGIDAVDAMTGAEFERRLAVLFTSEGHRVAETGATGDFGADLVLEGDGRRTVVQAKRYRGRVGIEAVQQVIGARRYYGADEAAVVTNSTCTRAARALAEADGVRLVERDELITRLAAQAHADRPATGVALLARQVLEGVVLVGYALRGAARLAWWLIRSATGPQR